MSLLSMPFLIINYGGEMIYILEQRLHAQNIQKEKSSKVLQDVTRAMFSQKFVAELLKPQGLYSNNATREIFDRLAHSSIMRLSESSMDKLYDLMTMGFKYQLVSCLHPRELIDITLNHLESIRSAVEGSPTAPQIEEAIAVFTKLCRELSSAEFAQIRQSLSGFLQDKRIKVSLFLQDKIQNSDGTIALQRGGPLVNDPTVEAPGSIKYFDDAGNVTSTERFDSPLAPLTGERLAGDPFDGAARDSKLGKNLYTVDRSKKKEAAKAPAAAAAAAATTTSSQKLKETKGAVVGELASLRELIGTSKPAESFSFPLFPETTEDPAAPNREITINAISREDIERTNAELKHIIDSMASAEVGGKEKDLLEMMDEAAGM